MAFGDHPFGHLPFAGVPDISATVQATFGVVATSDYRVYVGTREEFTAAGDLPPRQPIEGTLANLTFKRSIIGGAGIFGPVLEGSGEITINNTDARYDIFPQQYAVDGRAIVAKIGGVSTLYRNRLVVLNGTASDLIVDDDTLRISAEDKGYRLEVPLQTSLYGGAGGADGGSDLAGKRKPRAFGYPRNCECPLVSANDLIYQVNDGPVNDIPAVYDRAVALTQGADYASYAALAAASISAGQYATCLAEGFFRLESQPDGTVTADIEGDATDSTFVSTTADVVRRILNLASDLSDPAEIYEPAFTAFAAVQSAAIGYWADHNDNSSVADALARLLRGVTGWWGFTRQGKFGIWVFSAPVGPPVWSFRDDRESIRITRDRVPESLSPPPWRFRVAYARNETVQTDLDGSNVSAERRAFCAEPFRLATSDATLGASIKSDHPFAQDPAPIESYFVNQSDAQTEADRLQTLFRASRALYRVTLGLQPYNLDVGDVIELQRNRYDLAAGRMMRVGEVSENMQTRECEVVAYG